MQIDFIIVSNSKTDEHFAITSLCIESILDSASCYNPNIYVVEQNKKVEHFFATTIHYDYNFNYNKCLNHGISKSKSFYKGLCNNDLFFHKNWGESMIDAFSYAKENSHLNIGSFSPYCLKTHINRINPSNNFIIGNRIGIEFTGWCLFTTEDTLNRIGGKLNDSVSFWYSDDIYSFQLSFHEIRHVLVCNSFVTHIGSMTLSQLNRIKYKDFTVGQKQIFLKEREQIIQNYGKEKNGLLQLS